MGEVYRARDSRLKREVALKVLPPVFAADAERMARFQREAELLASLNHPNIATIHGVEAGALVMELVEGENLRGPLPLADALPLAKQVAEALEYAHERGVVHRDLKPANIKVTSDGAAKLLDFGLAKAVEDPLASSELANSPTLTLGATRAGIILGTAAYMSPEQAHGKPADRRADIWSFGAVLYEMLTGKPAFTGESVSDTLASVLKIDPDWNQLPSDTPRAIRKLLQRCLTRDRKQRLQAIGEARIIIDDVLSGSADDRATAARPSTRWQRGAPLAWMAAALFALIAGALGWPALRGPTAGAPHVMRFTVDATVANVPGALAISPDGTRLAFVGGPASQIYVRAVDDFDARPISGTETSLFLSFSPDGESLSFITGGVPNRVGRTDGRLKRVSVNGGPVQTLADIQTAGLGPPTQHWGPDGNILFSQQGKLLRMSAKGGNPELVAAPDKNERYIAGAQLLPDGVHVLASIYLQTGLVNGHRVVALDTRTGEKKVLLEKTGIATYVPSPTSPSTGYLAYYDFTTATLLAVPFDATRLTVSGVPVPVIEGIRGNSGPFGLYGISETGTLAYVAGISTSGTGYSLVWVDRTGNEEPLKTPTRPFNTVRLSRDGQQIAASIVNAETEDIWLLDVARGGGQRLTSEGWNGGPVWTPDGQRLFFERRPISGAAVLTVSTDGTSPSSVVTTWNDGPIAPSDVSRDGTLIGYYPRGQGLWVMPVAEALTGKGKLAEFLDARTRRLNPVFSPDGKWVAFRSDQSGGAEIYVAPYPGPGSTFPISVDGGVSARWSGDGRELFYRIGDKMMVVDVETAPRFRASPPRMLFEKAYANSWDVDVNGKRFLMIKQPAAQRTDNDRVSVVLNWHDELRRRVPATSQ